MKKLEQLYEGKAKKVFKTDDPKCLIVDYKDDATAFNGEKKGQIVQKNKKGRLERVFLFPYLRPEQLHRDD